MKARVLLVIVALIAIAAPRSHAGSGGCLPVVSSPIENQLSAFTVGVDQREFSDGSQVDGVPVGWGSSSDYGANCTRFTGLSSTNDSIVKQTIPAQTSGGSHEGDSGDVSINRRFAALPNQRYELFADADIWGYPTGRTSETPEGGLAGDFRARLKIAACRGFPCTQSAYTNGQENLIKEFYSDLCTYENMAKEPGTNGEFNCGAYDRELALYQRLSVPAIMPEGTKYLTINFRAREHKTDVTYGTASLTYIALVRFE